MMNLATTLDIKYHDDDLHYSEWIGYCQECDQTRLYEESFSDILEETDRVFCQECQDYTIVVLTSESYRPIVEASDVTPFTWYHATAHKNFGEIVDALTKGEPTPDNRPDNMHEDDEWYEAGTDLIHLGTREFCEGYAMTRLCANQLYKVTLNPEAITTPGIEMDDYAMGGDWSNYSHIRDVQRYKNYYESIGSICLVVRPFHILSVERMSWCD